jgi:hypothetical protein
LEKILQPILFVVALTFASVVQARITDPGQQKVEPFADGAQFGTAGAYIKAAQARRW